MTAALSFAEHAVTALAYLFIVAGVIAVLMHATGLTQQRQPRPRHRAGDPPPEPQMWLEDCIVCADDDITDLDDLPPDLADKALRSMRECEADAVVRLRRAMEEEPS